jgi:hypothetical protein
MKKPTFFKKGNTSFRPLILSSNQLHKECEQCGSIIDYDRQYKCSECGKTLCPYCYESHQKFGCK